MLSGLEYLEILPTGLLLAPKPKPFTVKFELPTIASSTPSQRT